MVKRKILRDISRKIKLLASSGGNQDYIDGLINGLRLARDIVLQRFKEASDEQRG